MKRFLPKQLEEKKIMPYMGMMGLCNGTDVSGRDESGEDIRHAIYESSG
jgi:hypothetical protein